MASTRLSLMCLTFTVLVLLVHCDNSFETRSLDDPIKTQEEKDLIDALQDVLEKLKNQGMPATTKKLGWVSSCDVGEECALRKGSRIGQLCSCPRGTSCNFSTLKCL